MKGLKNCIAVLLCVLVFTTNMLFSVPALSYDVNTSLDLNCASSLLLEDDIEISEDPLLYGRNNYEIPDSFDISTSEQYSKYLPPVGNQLPVGSCSSFASTYYHFTYEIAKLKDWSASETLHQFSPMWAYRNINSGNDDGGHYVDNYRVLKFCGALTEAVMPTPNEFTDEYKTWCTDKDLMKQALQYRVTQYFSHSFLSDTDDVNSDGTEEDPNHRFNGCQDQDLYALKLRLSEGYIVPVSASGFNYDFLPGEKNNESIGKVAIANYYKKGSTAPKGHDFVIVGYDDSIYCDLNQNGQQEENEWGAFKIMNSWGDKWCDEGFAWVMYDALNNQVEQDPQGNMYNLYKNDFGYDRCSAFDSTYYTIEVTDEPPVVYAEITIPPVNDNSIGVVCSTRRKGEEYFFNRTSFIFSNKTETPVERVLLLDITNFSETPESSSIPNKYSDMEWKITVTGNHTDTGYAKIIYYEPFGSQSSDAVIAQGTLLASLSTSISSSYLGFSITEKEGMNNPFFIDYEDMCIILKETSLTTKDIQNGLLGGKYRVFSSEYEIDINKEIGTGCTVKCTCQDDVIAEFTVIRYGDVNGDAMVNFQDYFRLCDSVYGERPLAWPYSTAGVCRRLTDLNAEGTFPNEEDIVALKEYLDVHNANENQAAGTYSLRYISDYYLAVDATNFELSDNTKVQLAVATGNSNQQWVFQQQSDGYYRISPLYNPQMSLTVNEKGDVVVSKELGTANQRWSVRKDSERTIILSPQYHSDQFLSPIPSGIGGQIKIGDGIYPWVMVSGDFPPEQSFHLPDGAYRIQNEKSGLYLNGAIAAQSNSTLRQEAELEDNQQVWLFSKQEDGYYTIASGQNPNLAVTATGANSEVCQLQYCTGEDTQLWRIVTDDGGTTYRFISKAYPGHAIAVYAASTAAGGATVLFGDTRTTNAKWQITPTTLQTLPNGVYSFSNVKSGLLLDGENYYTADNTKVEQWEDNGGENQRWVVTYRGGGYYTIQAAYTADFYLKAINENQVKLVSGYSEEVLWAIVKNTDGSYRLASKVYPSKTAVVEGALTSNGASVILFTDNGTPNGFWNLQLER